MTIPGILEKMIALSRGNRADISHFTRVWAYARAIGESEGLDGETQFLLEAEAIVHDIACPLCREKYGEAGGKLQERESPALVDAFFAGTDVTAEQSSRIRRVVSRHHTYEGVDGPDWQILLEADYIVNASDGGYPAEAVRRFADAPGVTPSGRRLIREVFVL